MAGDARASRAIVACAACGEWICRPADVLDATCPELRALDIELADSSVTLCIDPEPESGAEAESLELRKAVTCLVSFRMVNLFDRPRSGIS